MKFMMQLRWLLATTIIFLATSCGEKKHGAFVVTGKIENAPGKKITLMELPYASPQPVVLDSTSLKEKGTFTLRGRADEEGIFRLVIENGPEIILINDNKSIRINMDVNDYLNYTVEGSPASLSLYEMFKAYRQKDSTLISTFSQLDSLSRQQGNDSLVTALRIKRDVELKEMNTIVRDFIENSTSPAAIFYALGLASRTMPAEELRPIAETAVEKHPEHSGLARVKSLLALQSPQGYPLLNQQAPDLTMPTLDDKQMSISSLKGQYVLVDFWASWCKPCRDENPNLVAAYQKYKDNNFTMLGVSLDKTKNAWKQAVESDNLTWHHMSDLKFWESAAVQAYKFEGIPFNVLLDPSGKIIASNLRGEELHTKLAEVLQ